MCHLTLAQTLTKIYNDENKIKKRKIIKIYNKQKIKLISSTYIFRKLHLYISRPLIQPHQQTAIKQMFIPLHSRLGINPHSFHIRLKLIRDLIFGVFVAAFSCTATGTRVFTAGVHVDRLVGERFVQGFSELVLQLLDSVNPLATWFLLPVVVS